MSYPSEDVDDDEYNGTVTTEEEPSSESEDDQSDLEETPLEFHRDVFMFELPDGSKTIFCRFSLVQIGGNSEGSNWTELDKLSAIILKFGGLIDRRYILTKNSNGEIDLQAKNPIGSRLRQVAPETHEDIPIFVGTFSPKIHQEFLRSFRAGLSQDIFNSQYLEDCWSKKKMINLDPLKYRVGKTIFEEYDPNLILKGEKKWRQLILKGGQQTPAQIPIKSSPKRPKMRRVTRSASKSPEKPSSSSSSSAAPSKASSTVNRSPRKMAPTNKIEESTTEESDSKDSEDEDDKKTSQNRQKRKFLELTSSSSSSKKSQATPGSSKAGKSASGSSTSSAVNGSPPKRSSPRKMAPTNYKIEESTTEESDLKDSEDDDENTSQNRQKRKFLKLSSSSEKSQATSGSSKASKSASGSSKESGIKSNTKRVDSKVKGKRAIIVEDSESESSEDEGEEESEEDIHVSILSEPSDGEIEANKEPSSKSDRSHKKKSKGRVLTASPDFTNGNEPMVKIDLSRRTKKDPENRPNRKTIFLHWEKQKLLDYVCKYKLFDAVGGNTIWRNMSDKGILPHRTWQSMRESFNKRVLPNLHDFKIPDECKKELRRRTWLK